MYKCYEKYPIWFIFPSNLLTFSIYAIGIYIFFLFSIFFTMLYLVFIVWCEIRLLKGSCIDCYYYNKICAFGRGKLCALLFKKGIPTRFIERKIAVKDFLPDFMIFIFPIIFALILLILNFSWIIVGLIIVLVILGFGGNALIRGSLSCKYCKQGKIGCPALEMFKVRTK